MDSLAAIWSYLMSWRYSVVVRRRRCGSRVLLLLLVLLAGCRFHNTYIPRADGFYLNPDKDLHVIGRVAIVELDNDSSYPQVSADVTEALFVALQKKQVFGLTVVRQQDPAWRGLQLELNSTYDLEQLVTIRKTLQCDAILVGTVTEYRPYPHLVMGLRMKLIDLKDGELLWALERVWDAADKATQRRIESYLQRRVRSDPASLDEQLVVVSSLQFVKFVAYEVGETLRPHR
jgi:hypothetical protein